MSQADYKNTHDRNQHDNESEFKYRNGSADDTELRAQTQPWMNMAHWDMKYVWYAYYASTNTGAESGRKEEDWRKKGKERD